MIDFADRMDCTAAVNMFVVNMFAVNRTVVSKVENTVIVANKSAADWSNLAEGW